MSVVRRATAADAEVVGGLLYDFNTEFETATDPAAELARRFAALLRRVDQAVLLAEPDQGGAAEGFGYLTLRQTPWYDGPVAQLEELYVRSDLRDHGIGTALLRDALALARERDAGAMHINVDEVDTDTRRFYERHGFLNVLPGTDYRMLCYEIEL